MIDASKLTVNPNSGYEYSVESAAVSWGDIISTLGWDSKIKSNLDDEELKKRVASKINEILDEDTTIEIMKKYLLEFIDKNIENPENLIKDVLVKRDEELSKCKEEIRKLRDEINVLKTYLPMINPINPGIYIDPYQPITTTPNITYTSGSSTTC